MLDGVHEDVIFVRDKPSVEKANTEECMAFFTGLQSRRGEAKAVNWALSAVEWVGVRLLEP